MRAPELKQLWAKAWLETRWGFALALAILLTFSVWSAIRFPDAVRAGVHDMELHRTANAALKGLATYSQVEIFERLTILWSILSVMLGTGGLLKEKLQGTASFSLSMPVQRRGLVAVRGAVTLCQAGLLAVASCAVLPLAFLAVGQKYPLAGSLAHAAILFVSGSAFVVFGTLISVLLEGGSWPTVIGASTVFLSLVLGQAIRRLAITSPFAVLSGQSYFQHGSFPWMGMAASVVLAALMAAFATWFVKWQDF